MREREREREGRGKGWRETEKFKRGEGKEQKKCKTSRERRLKRQREMMKEDVKEKKCRTQGREAWIERERKREEVMMKRNWEVQVISSGKKGRNICVIKRSRINEAKSRGHFHLWLLPQKRKECESFFLSFFFNSTDPVRKKKKLIYLRETIFVILFQPHSPPQKKKVKDKRQMHISPLN